MKKDLSYNSWIGDGEVNFFVWLVEFFNEDLRIMLLDKRKIKNIKEKINK